MDEKKAYRHYTQVKVLEKSVNISFYERIETEEDYIKNNYNSESQHAVHEDFRNALDGLKGHLIKINLSGLLKIEDYQKVPDKILSQFKITGFTISGSDESEGVILTGMKKNNPSGQWWNVVTPLTRFENTEGYDQVGELYHDIQIVVKEADAYLKGKFGPGTQWSLSFDKKMDDEPEKTEKE